MEKEDGEERDLGSRPEAEAPSIGFEIFHIDGGTGLTLPSPGRAQDDFTGRLELFPNANLDTPTSHHSPVVPESTFTFDSSGSLLVSIADGKSHRFLVKRLVYTSRDHDTWTTT